MPNSKMSAFLSLLLVFASGAVVGGFGYHAFVRSAPPPASAAKGGTRPDPDAIRKARIEEVTKDVDLDPGQVTQLGQIYDEAGKEYFQNRQQWNVEMHRIRDEQIQKVKKMLRPDQLPKYENYLAKQEAAEQERMRKRKGGNIVPERQEPKK